MIRGDISPNKFNDEDLVLVIDYDLFFKTTIKYKFPFFWEKGYSFNDYNRKILRLIKNVNSDFDSILIAVIGKDTTFEEKVLNQIMQLPYTLVNFDNNKDYGVWLNMVEPASHLATKERRYFNKNVSKYVSPTEL